MEVVFATVFIFHLSCCFNVTSDSPINKTTAFTLKTPEIHNIRTGSTVNLSCDKNHRDKTMWYGQKINRSPFIILSAELTSKQTERPSVKFRWGYNPRMNLTWNPTNNTMGFIIKNITESDEGFYFCIIGSGILTTPGTGHILKLEETNSYSTSTTFPLSTVEKIHLSDQSGQCRLPWVLVAILFCMSILITSLVFLIIQNKRKRITETSYTGQRTHQEENTEEDGVMYSTLHFSKSKKTAK